MTNRQYQFWLRTMKFGKTCGCHQLTERSFKIKGVQFPFCARCTGIIIGQFIFAPMVFLLGLDSLVLAGILIGIMAIDGLLQYFKILMSNNYRRFITGVMAGVGLMILTVYLIQYLLSLFR